MGGLGPGWLLSPERYGARADGARGDAPLGSLVAFVSEGVAPGFEPRGGLVRVLDTGDAREGFARAPEALPRATFRSAKKRVLPGDVLVSRLRPYLRQVAYLDAPLFERQGCPVDVVVSCEFCVLRGLDGPAAFLVPWLLSGPVQARLAAAQEGGHHPRVARETLDALPVPRGLLETRASLSAQVEAAAAAFRGAEAAMAALVGEAG